MTRIARLVEDIRRFMASPRQPPLFTRQARGRKRKAKNPIHISTQDKKHLGQAIRNPILQREEVKVLKKLDRNVNTQLTDSEMDILRNAGRYGRLPHEQQVAISNLIAHQYNNGRPPE